MLGDSVQLNVLVIDDDEQVRSLLAQLITREGHQAITAASAEEGLEYLPNWTIQIAFIDQGLPGTEGLVLSEYLRKNNPEMQIVLITGSTEQRLRRRSRELAIDFLAKPIQPPRIFQLLDDCRTALVNRARAQQQAAEREFAPPLADFVEEVPAVFDMPKIPNRVRERLVRGLERCLYNLRSNAQYNERDRVAALSALLTAKLLQVELPKSPAGISYFREYDSIMRSHGRRCEFTAPDEVEQIA